MGAAAATAKGSDLSLAELRASLGSTTSVWTIDLAHLLVAHAGGGGAVKEAAAAKKKSREAATATTAATTAAASKSAPPPPPPPPLRVTLSTTTTEAREEYASAPFYSLTLRDDAARIAFLFDAARLPA